MSLRSVLVVVGFVGATTSCALIAKTNGTPDPSDHMGGVTGPAGSTASPNDAPKDAPSTNPTALPPPCAADITSDPKNCGYCGHACRDGACNGGFCPTDPITTSSEASSIVVDTAQLFWTDASQGEVRSVDKSRGGTGVVLASKDNVGDLGIKSGNGQDTTPPLTALAPSVIRLVDQRFFFLDGKHQSIIGCAKAGCTAATVAWVGIATHTSLTALAISAGQVFWGDHDGLDAITAPAAAVHDPQANGPGSTYVDDTRAANPIRIAVGEAAARSLVWSNASGVWQNALPPLTSSAFSGFAPKKLVEGSTNDLTAGADAVFVATSAGLIRAAAGATSKVADGNFLRVVADPIGIYAVLALPDAHAIVHLSAGGVLDPLVRSTRAIGEITLDPEFVYFTVATATGVEIRRVVR